ncbi:MAG: hypothetical protein WHT29_07565 [Bacteroidales bacterium]
MTPAKILLFGEYTVLVGSQALAIPFPNFSCQLVHKSASEQSLTPFVNYLLSQPEEFSFLHLDRLQFDWQQGLSVISDIPVQYGVGSSGAITAEIYRHYARSVDKPIAQVKSELASMEKFMHGNSSGIDPLVCFYKKPLLFDQEGTIHLINPSHPSDMHIFLIDSQTKAPTRDYVARFIDDYQHLESFTQQVQQLTTLVNECITAYLNTSSQLPECIKKLSQLQQQIFPFLFPPTIIPHQQYGLTHDVFYIKLCGSGGGGYFLGFTQKPHDVEQYFKAKEIAIQWVNRNNPEM